MEVELGSDVEVDVAEGKKSRIKIEKLFDFEPRGYYVYVHRKKTTHEIFYVGKGVKTRGWGIRSRSKMWYNVTNKHGVLSEIIFDNLTEDEALTIEKELITYYGRSWLGEGCLVNYRIEGQTAPEWELSEHPAADKRIWHFVNTFTYESFIGLRVEFREKTGVSMTAVVNGACRASGGWTTMDNLSTVSIELLRNPNSERQVIQDIYRIYNLETKETKECRLWDIKKMVGVNYDAILSGDVLSFGDWCFEENKHKWYSFKKDYKEYLFVHDSGQQILGTRAKFKETTGLNINDLFRTTSKKRRRCWKLHGWRVIK